MKDRKRRSRGVFDCYEISRFLLLLMILLGFVCGGSCQGSGGGEDMTDTDNVDSVDYVTQVVYDHISNFSTTLIPMIAENFGFRVKDAKVDWNSAFNFSNKLEFLSNCFRYLHLLVHLALTAHLLHSMRKLVFVILTVTSFLKGKQISLVEEPIYGLILLAVERYSVQQDHTVHLLLR